MSGRLGSVGEVGIGCKAYNASAVYFATKNWTAEYIAIENYREGVLKSVLSNGTLLKRFGGEEVYMLLLHGSASIPNTPSNYTHSGMPPPVVTPTILEATKGLVRCPFPDGDTFLNMGYEWEQIKQVPTTVLNRIPEGHIPLPYRHHRFTFLNVFY